MDTIDSEQSMPELINLAFNLAFTPDVFLLIGVIIVLLLCSAFISGSEVAFFSIQGKDLLVLKEKKSQSERLISDLLEKPRRLLATILISNNVVNIAIIVLFTILNERMISFADNTLLAFLVEILFLAFVLILFGEIIPKVYASHNNLKFAAMMALPLKVVEKITYPIGTVLVKYSTLIEKKIFKYSQSDVSLDEIKHAIDIATKSSINKEESKILKGIVNFSSTYVKQIMKPRMDVVAIDMSMHFDELLKIIDENRYSRMPVYDSSFDNIIGVLYIKDVLPHLGKTAAFNWQSLIRKPYFVPENKMIDDLLREFQKKKVHLAIVVDEYGGTCGIVTLEDILEEIVGEISDEFDEDEIYYSKLDNFTYVFDGKTALTDVARIASIPEEIFDSIKDDAETIGGLLVELKKQLPALNEVFNIENIECKVESVDTKRVKRVKITILEKEKK